MNRPRTTNTLTILLLLCATYATAESPLPVQTVSFDAPSVGKTMKYNVVLPANYEDSDKEYPVLYLLHGFTSNFQLWALMDVPENAAFYDLIVIMPDAGNSWYVNWAESEEGQKNDWEDYMVRDLIDNVDATYRTIDAREGRAICGLSMGGYGAVMLGLRHPDLFCSVGSHSGALSHAAQWRGRIEAGEGATFRRDRSQLSTRASRRIGIEGFSSQAERSPLGREFVTAEDCDEYDPFTLVLKVPQDQLPHIHIDCGTEDGLIRSARAFKDLLIENTIPFSYAESKGRHLPAYWTREVGHSMAVQYNVIMRNLESLDAK